MRKMLILLTGLLMLFSYTTKAAHIIGGEITYRCFGNGKYQVTIKMYRDCYGGGAEFDSFTPTLLGQVTVFSGSSPEPFRNVLLDPPKIVNIEADLSSNCKGITPDLCVEEGVYSFSIDLPRSSESYYISYQRCCRNNTISNIYSPEQTGATYTVEITALAQEVCNNSPTFKDFPPVAICANEALNFDHGATDLEGDSLVYEFCAPLKGGSLADLTPEPETSPPYESVDFISPSYSIDRPLGGDPLVVIDPVTGVITGTPTMVGQYVVGICVKEYRDGKLLGVIQRDFQFNVVPCDFPVVADLDGETKDGKYFLYEICEGESLLLKNESYHLENIKNYNWELDLKDSILSSSNADLFIPAFTIGNYKGRMIINSNSECTDTAFVSVFVNPNPSVEFNYSFDTCDTGPVQFQLFLADNGRPIENYHWDFGDGNSSEEILSAHQYETAGTYQVSLTIADANGCSTINEKIINWTPAPPIPFETPIPAEGCAPLDVSFNSLEGLLDSTYEVSWEIGEGISSEEISLHHQYENPGVYDVWLNIVSAFGCEFSATYPEWIVVEAPPIANFSYSPEGRVNKREEVLFQNESENAIQWNWSFGDLENSKEENPSYKFLVPGAVTVALTVADKYGCTDSIAQVLDVQPVYHIYVPNAFSPNQDDTNEEFKAYVYCPLDQFEMKIFDRWGEQVFESKDVDQGWDGLKTNNIYQPGVYVWFISYVADGRKKVMSGDVTLVK